MACDVRLLLGHHATHCPTLLSLPSFSPPLPSTRLWSGTARAPPTDRSMRKGGASAASAPAAKSKKPSHKFALTLALYYLPGDDAVDPGATSIVRSIQGAVFSGDVWDAKSLVRAPVAAAPIPSPPHPMHGRAPSPPHRLLV